MISKKAIIITGITQDQSRQRDSKARKHIYEAGRNMHITRMGKFSQEYFKCETE